MLPLGPHVVVKQTLGRLIWLLAPRRTTLPTTPARQFEASGSGAGGAGSGQAASQRVGSSHSLWVVLPGAAHGSCTSRASGSPALGDAAITPCTPTPSHERGMLVSSSLEDQGWELALPAAKERGPEGCPQSLGHLHA